MSERLFLLLVGATILVSLYFEIDIMLPILSIWLILEGVTNIRLTTIMQKIRGKTVPPGLTVFSTKVRFNFDAYLAWRLMVPVMLGGSLILLQIYQMEVLWFFPWFMGFAIMGAGVSGVCPMILFLKWAGFK